MPILLVHGLGSSGRAIRDKLGPALPADGRVLAPDVRAHGSSTAIGSPADFTIDRLAAELVAALPGSDAPFTVIGESMGAAIALRIVLAGLLPVYRVLFFRPSFSDTPLPSNLRAFPVIGQLLRDLGPVDGAARFRETGVYAQALTESRLGAAGLIAQFGYPDAAARAIRLVEVPRNRAFGDAREPASVAVASAVVAAPRDPVHPVEVAQQWAGALGAPLRLLPARDDGEQAQLAELRLTVARWLATPS